MGLQRVTSALLLASCLGAPSARAEAPASFARLRDRATPVESLAAFLDKYVGACTDLFEKATCEANSRKARAEMTGKSYYVILDDSAARLLKPGGFNPATREFRIDLTPFFDAGGLALTEGAPPSQDSEGRPRIPLMALQATLPGDWMPMDMERLLRTQGVRIHLVFRPQGLWSLPAKGRPGRLEGVKAKLLAVRLTNARTGEEIALKTSE